MRKLHGWLEICCYRGFGVHLLCRKCVIDETHYWQRPSLREEAIAKSLRRQATVSCFFGTGANCRPFANYLKSRTQASARLCNLALPPLAPTDNGCSLSRRRSLRLQIRKRLHKARRSKQQEEELPPAAATKHANCRSGDGPRKDAHTSLWAKIWSFNGFEVPA